MWFAAVCAWLMGTIVCAPLEDTQAQPIATDTRPPLSQLSNMETNVMTKGQIRLFQANLGFRSPKDPTARKKCKVLPIGVTSGHADLRKRVRETWGHGECVFFVVGKTDGVWPEAEAKKEKDMILIDMEEAYAGENSILPYKTALWFSRAREWFPGFDYVLKTDDDSYVDVSAVREELHKVKPYYWGKLWPTSGPKRDVNSKQHVSKNMWAADTFPPYCSGAGYALSGRAVECLLKGVGDQKFLSMEDVATAVSMQACGMPATGTELVDVAGNYGEGQRWVIKHHLTGDQLSAIHAKRKAGMLQLWNLDLQGTLDGSPMDRLTEPATAIDASAMQASATPATNLAGMSTPTVATTAERIAKTYG